MANKVKDAINTAIGLIEHYDSEKAEQVLAEEEQVDLLLRMDLELIW